MRRKTKTIVNLVLTCLIILTLMLSRGYYPGMYFLKIRLNISHDIKAIVSLPGEVNSLLVYTDKNLLYYQLNNFLGFKNLSNKKAFRPESNHFLDSKENNWFEVTQDFEIYDLISNDGNTTTTRKIENEEYTSASRRYLTTPYNTNPKFLLDLDGNKYWVGDEGFYGLEEKYNELINVNLINKDGISIDVEIDNKILVNYFEQEHSRNFAIYQSEENSEIIIDKSLYEKVVSYIRTYEDGSNILETFYFDGENIILSIDILDKYGEVTSSPSLEFYLHPLIQEVLIKELVPLLDD